MARKKKYILPLTEKIFQDNNVENSRTEYNKKRPRFFVEKWISLQIDKDI